MSGFCSLWKILQIENIKLKILNVRIPNHPALGCASRLNTTSWQLVATSVTTLGRMAKMSGYADFRGVSPRTFF
jgi:hypothetical protein